MNTIRLLHGETKLSRSEMKHFKRGSLIIGSEYYDENPEELARWSIEQKEEAQKRLSEVKCSYDMRGTLAHIEEYALEYFECNKEGEFSSGSDFDLAETDYNGMMWCLLDDTEKEKLLKGANITNTVLDEMEGSGVCTVHLQQQPYTIEGVMDYEVAIDDDSIIRRL